MKKTFLLLSLIASMATAFTLTSCSRNDDFGFVTAQNGTLKLIFNGENITNYNSLEVEIMEVNTGAVTHKTLQNLNSLSLEIPYGSYKITANGVVIANNEEVRAAGLAQTDLTSPLKELTVSLEPKKFHDDFIIEEVFFAGIKTSEGKNYNSSRYFKLTNNTSKVLFADQLILGQSEFLTTDNKNPTPTITNLSFAVKGVMVLPGTGNQYPVEPGDFIVIADNAINHKENTSTAYDLHNANFEFPSTNPSLGQIDNPAVPNVEVIYSQMNYNMFLLHNRGFESYVIARFPAGQSKETFLANQKYDYTYQNSAGSVTSKSTYSIPNSWIVDAQNNSVATKFIQTVTSASIDAGWASVGSMDSDPNRFGKSVRRKITGQMANGKNLFKDTNNSTEDFTKDSQPSLKDGIIH